MIVEDELKSLRVPKPLEPYLGAYYRALCKRSESDLVGRSEFLCFKRFIDMYNSGKYLFAEKFMKRLFRFLALLIYIDEDGKPHRLELYPAQMFIMCGIFGFRHKDESYLTQDANLYMARRNGKSFLLSSVLHALIGMSRFRKERIILASCKGSNATICFDEFCKFIENDSHLEEMFSSLSRTGYWARHKLTGNRLEMFKTGGASKKGLDGFTNRVAVIDEEMLCDEIITKTIQDGQAHFAKGSLLVTMSTAQYSIGSDNHKKWMALRTQLHAGELPDETFLFLCEPDEEDIAAKDYGNISFWGKSNPVLLFEKDGYTIKQHIKAKYLAKAQKALAAKGFALQTFCTKQANIWYSAEDKKLCTYDQLMACRVNYSFEDVIKAGYKYWYIGGDLAMVNDLASINWQVYCYEDEEGKLVAPGQSYAKKRLFHHTVSWMPRNKLTKHVETDKFCYYDYLGTELQLCDAAGGENIDTRQIYEYIKKVAQDNELVYVTLGFDPYNIAGVEGDLEELGTLILQNQSPKALSQYIEAFSQSIKDGEMAYYEGHEDIFEKAVTNCVLFRNTTGYYSIEKITLNASSNIRIDPVDACLNGFIANYIDNSRGVVSGDDAIDSWDDIFGGD